MRFTEREIRRIIREEIDAIIDQRTRLSTESVDDQIDSLLIKFESESIKTESRARRSIRLMFEEPEGEKGEGPSAVGSEERDEEWSGEPNKPPIDIDRFAHRVVRLMENYNSLLDVRTVILNRSKNYIRENYDDFAVLKFEDTLEVDHGISLNPRDNEEERPVSVGAGPVGGV